MYKPLGWKKQITQLKLCEHPDFRKEFTHRVKPENAMDVYTKMGVFSKFSYGKNHMDDFLECLNNHKNRFMRRTQEEFMASVSELSKIYEENGPGRGTSVLEMSVSCTEKGSWARLIAYHLATLSCLGADGSFEEDTICFSTTALAHVMRWEEESKQAFRFDRDFLESVSTQSIPDVPVSILENLPFQTFFVDFDLSFPTRDVDGGDVIFSSPGCFVTIERFGDKLRLMISLYMSVDSEESHEAYLMDAREEWDIDTSLQSTASKCDFFKTTNTELRERELQEEIYERIMNCLLYLCSEKPDIERPQKIEISPKARKKLNIKQEESFSEYGVGVRIGAAIRKSKEIQTHYVGSSQGERKPMRPHLRRAHWQHYWTGPRDKERILILKWVEATPVNYRPEVEFDTVIHNVKGD